MACQRVVESLERRICLSSYTLQALAPIIAAPDGATLNLAERPHDLAVVFCLTGGSVGSLLIGLDNRPPYQLLNAAPHALFGYKNGLYFAGTFSIGQHTLYAGGWAWPNAVGAPTIAFQVIDRP